MRLTVFTDFALRVLMCLALEPDRRFTIAEIAKSYGISRNHLMKVVNHLTRAGLVESARGVGGGLKLARDPATVTVGEIVRGSEEDFALVECFRARNACLITPECELKQTFGEALSAFFEKLDGRTLADLVARDRPLRRRLKISA